MTPANVSRGCEADFDHWRRSIANKMGDKYRGITEEQLRSIEILPNQYLDGPKLVVPAEMLPSGIPQQYSFRCITWAKALPVTLTLPADRAEVVINHVKIICVSAAIIPRTARRRKGYLPKLSTWLVFCRKFLKLSRWCLENRPHERYTFAHLSAVDFASAVSGSSAYLGAIVKEVCLLKALGAPIEWPDLYKDSASSDLRGIVSNEPYNESTEQVGMAAQNVNRDTVSTTDGTAVNAVLNRPVPKGHQPLPDRFIAEAGWRVTWLIENLGPGTIALIGAMEALDPKASLKKRSAAVKRFCRNLEWRDIHGEPVNAVPFELVLYSKGRQAPRKIDTTGDVDSLLSLTALSYLLQMCHAFMISLGTGMRVSELASLTDRCVTVFDHGSLPVGRFEGTTFKLSEFNEGETRSWPINAISRTALMQQVHFCNSFRNRSSRSLWVQLAGSATGEVATKRGDPLTGFGWDTLIRSLGLKDAIDDRGLHHHRFRKTVARLCALALVGSPKILMDLFGHRSIDMTLTYILSNPDLAAEVKQIADEMVVINAAETLGAVQEKRPGGRPSAVLESWGLPARGENELGSATIQDAARLITVNGLLWNTVRPGVICTKGPGQAGPCTRAAGHPDPARCQPDCGFRLEAGRMRDDAEQAIGYAIEKLNHQTNWSDNPGAMYWLGQLRHHMARFPDMIGHWADDPVVVRLRAWEADRGLGRGGAGDQVS